MTLPADAAIRAQIDRYFAAYESHDAKGCAAVYADDAWLTCPWGPPVQGNTAIEATHEMWFEEGERNKVYTILDLQIAGSTAVCLLRFDAEIANGDDVTAIAGISLNAMAETVPGVWLITHSSLNELDSNSTA